jgi:hypothetical protein
MYIHGKVFVKEPSSHERSKTKTMKWEYSEIPVVQSVSISDRNSTHEGGSFTLNRGSHFRCTRPPRQVTEMHETRNWSM